MTTIGEDHGDDEDEDEEEKGRIIDLTDLTAFNSMYSRRQGGGAIGIRHNKSSADKTEEIIRKIMLSSTREEELAAIDKNVVRLGNLYGCGTKAVKKVSKAVDRRIKTKSDLYRYKEADWISVENKLWHCNFFKDKGVSWMSDYQHAEIDLPSLHNLMDISLQMKFTTREIAALVQKLECTDTVLGDITIDFNKLLKELKRLGNIIRTSDHLQVRHEHETGLKSRLNRAKQSQLHSPRGTGSNVDPVDLDSAVLYTGMRTVASACQLHWKKENKHFMNVLHEVPTGTLDGASLREFFTYNINTKLALGDCLMLIQYYNGISGRLAYTISMEDMIKEMKKLALEKLSVFSPPCTQNYDEWVTSVRALNEQLVSDRRDIRIAKKSVGIMDGTSGIDHDDAQDDNSSVSSLGNSISTSSSCTPVGYQINEAYKHRVRAAIQNSPTAVNPKVAMIVRRQSSVTSSGESTTEPSSTCASTVGGTLHSIKYNAASPNIFSAQASQELLMKGEADDGKRGKIKTTMTVRAADERTAKPTPTVFKDSGSASVESERSPLQNESMSFVAVAKVLQKARQARVHLAGGQEAYEDCMKVTKQRDKEKAVSGLSPVTGCHSECSTGSSRNRHIHMAMLPTSQGLREPASLKGCGSSVMRAKTPLYLVRPTNASDSLLGLAAQSHLVGRKANDEMPLSILGPASDMDDDRRSVSSSSAASPFVADTPATGADDLSMGSAASGFSRNSQMSKHTKGSKSRRRGEQAGKRCKEQMYAQLDLAPLDKKAIGLRYTLRYKQLGEFVRCYKLASKLTMEDILRSLWAAVQAQQGRGIDILSDMGVLIDRNNFVAVIQQLVPAMSSNDVQLLFSSLDPTRKGLIPCHLLHGLAKSAMLQAGCDAHLLVKTMLYGAAWEQLNSRDLRDSSIVSALSTSNDEFYQQQREKQKKDEVRQQQSEKHFDTREQMQEQQRIEMRKAMEIAQKVKLQKDVEEQVVNATYLPAGVVSSCVKALCSSEESEQNLHVYLEGLFKASYSKNLRDLDMAGKPSAGISSSINKTTICVGRPKRIDYVMVSSALAFAEEPDIRRMLQVEHRRATKAMGPHMHRNKARESL